jgi:hypothetical protein
MTAETIQNEVKARSPSPKNRKRHASDESGAKDCKTKMDSPAEKKPVLVTNNGWGPLFKNRETFVEMHLC